MTPEKIESVVLKYKIELSEQNITAKRIDTSLSFASISKKELLEHASYLCDRVLEDIDYPEKFIKINKNLIAIQMCLSFAGIYNMDELMSHSRPT